MNEQDEIKQMFDLYARLINKATELRNFYNEKELREQHVKMCNVITSLAEGWVELRHIALDKK